jgi:hypothetical protein
VSNDDDGARVLAAALYEIRIQLSGHIGRTEPGPVNDSATLAYALHNDCLALLRGEVVDADAALARLDHWDRLRGTELAKRVRRHLTDP